MDFGLGGLVYRAHPAHSVCIEWWAMKINQYGKVVITRDGVEVSGWLVERDPKVDPSDATNEQLLAGYAANWALAKLKQELQRAAYNVFREMRRRN